MKSGINDTSIVRKTLGEQLKKAREDKGFSRQAFCDAINTCADRPIRGNKVDELSIDRLKKWEYGENPVELEWLPILCNVLQIDIGYLFGQYQEHTRVISDISVATGLSPKAASALRIFKTSPVNIGFIDGFIQYCGLNGTLLEKVNNAIGSLKEAAENPFSASTYYFMKSLKEAFGDSGKAAKGSIQLPPGAVPLDAKEASEYYIDFVSRLFREFLSDYVKKAAQPKEAAKNEE